MSLLDWLRKLGIFRFGKELAVYRNATERPLSLQQDDIFNSENDVTHFGKQASCEASPKCEDSQP